MTRLAVPPQQHPRVHVVGGVERVGLNAQDALHHPQPHVERPSRGLVGGHSHAPLAAGQPAGVTRKRLDEVVDHVQSGHPRQGTVATVRAIVQRVSEASVEVDGEWIAAIGPGLLVLLGVRVGDGEEEADRVARKVAALRIFDDVDGRMNLSVVDVGGEVLCVSQFTVYGDVSKSNRPSFVDAAPASEAEPLYERVRHALSAQGGRFGTHMGVRLVNDGPVTLLVEV